MTGDIIDQIDRAIGCQMCHETLPEDGPSPDFCGESCEEGWYAARNGKPQPVEDTSALTANDFYGTLSGRPDRDRAALLEPPRDDTATPEYRGPHDPVHPCRRMLTRHCPASYGDVCGDRPCARFESDDPTPWQPELDAEYGPESIRRDTARAVERRTEAYIAALEQITAPVFVLDDHQRGWLSQWVDRIRGNR